MAAISLAPITYGISEVECFLRFFGKRQKILRILNAIGSPNLSFFDVRTLTFREVRDPGRSAGSGKLGKWDICLNEVLISRNW